MESQEWLHDYYQGSAMGITCKDCDDAADIINSLQREIHKLQAELLIAQMELASLKTADSKLIFGDES